MNDETKNPNPDGTRYEQPRYSFQAPHPSQQQSPGSPPTLTTAPLQQIPPQYSSMPPPFQQMYTAHPLVENYLKTLKKQLKWVPKQRKQRFLQEARGHIEEIAAGMTGADYTRYSGAILRFGEAELVAGQFVEAYGYGKKYLIAMSLLCFFLGLLTIPLQIPFQTQTQGLCFGLPLLVTVIVFFLIIRVSMKAGKWTGFTVGLSCGVSRLLVLGILLALISSNPDVEDKVSIPGGVVAAIVMVSLLMVLSGYLPGRSLQKYQGN